MEYGVYGTIATLAVALVVHAVRVTWTLRGVEKDIREHCDAQIDNVSNDVKKLERDGVERAEVLRREFGETASALRTKIHEIETWNRDTFVRKDSFELVINRIEKSMEKIGDRFEEKLDKIDRRIELLIPNAKNNS